MGSIALPDWLRRFQPGGDVTLAVGVGLLLAVLVVPLPTLLLDAGLALSITLAVLVLILPCTSPCCLSTLPLWIWAFTGLRRVPYDEWT